MSTASRSFPELLPDLIGLIYDCALDPSLWPRALAHIGDALHFVHAALSLQAMPSGAVLLNVSSGIPSPWLERIGQYGPDVIALWGGAGRIAATPLEEPVLLSDMNPAVLAGACDNRFYSEWRRPQGLLDSVSVGLTRDAHSLSTCSFARHERLGPIGEPEREALRGLAPHLRRAVTISRLLDAQTVAAATFEAVVEATGAPILITDGQLNVLYANGPAQALLGRRDPLTQVGRRLVTNRPAATQALAVAIATAGTDEADIGHRGLAIPVIAGDGAPHALHVLPLGGGTLRPGLVNEAVAAIFVSSAGPAPSDAGSLIAQLFGLSAKEARVFELIALGHTPGEAAAEMGIGVSTVRTHLLRIFDKTGLRRQADLVRMAASLALPRG
ncbi:MAG: helix-turn-helix transcriptional regulator [Phenylobacterium sp.]|uniref:helix-turn-helix transcriptional regulator n=1 Tax=Phenylobacterium sp. TaxID=1871053 RepID=UPI0025FE25E7|nr:LuxR C-terminal-related transcriptional regulator [Phenylobacterium sp.]MBI1196567.1 helix-turn-helix transcriptional regulator [Phenylobacterium sp.]